MKPKIIEFTDWQKLIKEYQTLDLEIWNSLDAMKKLALLKGIFKLDMIPVFGKDFILNYPEDIYNFTDTNKFIIDIDTLNKIRKYVCSDKEIGGTIEYSRQSEQQFNMDYNSKNMSKINIFFTGNNNRIDLNLKRDTHSLFHTHPDDNRKYNPRDFSPPSILDIISYLAVIVKYIADIIIDLGNGIEHSPDDPLIIQNSIVVSNEAVYVYYISYPLVVSITKHLMELYRSRKDNLNNFVYEVEKLLEEMELSYASYLFPFNRDLNTEDLEEYLNTLSSLGILIKRFPYSNFPNMPEVYITL